MKAFAAREGKDMELPSNNAWARAYFNARATMRPSLEIPVSYAFVYLFCILSDALQQLMFDLGLEDINSFKTIRSPSDRNRNVKVEWYNTLDEANASLIKEKPDITFVMTK